MKHNATQVPFKNFAPSLSVTTIDDAEDLDLVKSK